MCKSYVGDARIQNSADIDTSTLNNINRERETLRDGGVEVDEECLQFIIFSECISTLQPCQGTVWCGEQSKADLLHKAEEVCTCMGTQMCENAIYWFLARVNTMTTYTQTSAAPPETCQDVTEGETLVTCKGSSAMNAMCRVALNSSLFIVRCQTKSAYNQGSIMRSVLEVVSISSSDT